MKGDNFIVSTINSLKEHYRDGINEENITVYLQCGHACY